MGSDRSNKRPACHAESSRALARVGGPFCSLKGVLQTPYRHPLPLAKARTVSKGGSLKLVIDRRLRHPPEKITDITPDLINPAKAQCRRPAALSLVTCHLLREHIPKLTGREYRERRVIRHAEEVVITRDENIRSAGDGGCDDPAVSLVTLGHCGGFGGLWNDLDAIEYGLRCCYRVVGEFKFVFESTPQLVKMNVADD